MRKPRKPFSGVQDPELKRLRALMMIQFRVKTGASINEVAEEFGVSDATVERVFSYAKKAGLIAKMEDQILNELLPKAKDAVKAGLEDTDNVQEAAKLGMDLMKSLVPSMKKSSNAKNQSPDGSGLANYIANLRTESGELDNVIDGHVEGSPEALESPTAPLALTEGDVASPGRDADRAAVQPEIPASVGE